MIKIFLYILQSLQSLEKERVVIGLIPAENEDILIPFEMVTHIAKKVDEIFTKNKKAQKSKDEQKEPTSTDDPSTKEKSPFDMLKKCILAIIEYTKEEMEMNKKLIGMPRFDTVKISEAIKNANDMNELEKKNEVIDEQRVEGSNDTVEENVKICLNKIPMQTKNNKEKKNDSNNLIINVCQALNILYNKRRTADDIYAEIIVYLRICFFLKVKAKFIKKHEKLTNEEFQFVDVVLNKKDEALRLYLFLTKLFAETKKSYDEIYIFSPKITCKIKKKLKNTELKIKIDKGKKNFKLETYMNETENGEIISYKKINDKVQKEYYVIAKNLDIFQQGNFTSYLNEKYTFTCDDHYRRNITVIIDKNNGIKENVEEESVEESIDEEDNAVEDNGKKDNGKKESGKEESGKEDNGKKDNGKKDNGKKDNGKKSFWRRK